MPAPEPRLVGDADADITAGAGAATIGVPAYAHPDDGSLWQALAVQPAWADIVVANVCSGPGTSRDPRWAEAFHGVRAAGARVVGYVDVGYLGAGGIASPSGADPSDRSWRDHARRGITEWYEHYGDVVSGVFLDRVPASHRWAALGTLRSLRRTLRSFDRGALLVLNPGTAAPSAMHRIADVIVTFEGSAAAYLSDLHQVAPQGRVTPGSAAVWHIVHSIPNRAAAAQVGTRARANGVDHLFATDATMPNPYAALPSGEVFEELRAGCRISAVPTEWGAAGVPSRPSRRVVARSSGPNSVPVTVRLEVRGDTLEVLAERVTSTCQQRIFLATSSPSTSRWSTGSRPQVAADWLIEDDQLYVHAGHPDEWSWRPVARIERHVDRRGSRWTLPLGADLLGAGLLGAGLLAGDLHVVHQAGPTGYSPVAAVTRCHAGR